MLSVSLSSSRIQRYLGRWLLSSSVFGEDIAQLLLINEDIHGQHRTIVMGCVARLSLILVHPNWNKSNQWNTVSCPEIDDMAQNWRMFFSKIPELGFHFSFSVKLSLCPFRLENSIIKLDTTSLEAHLFLIWFDFKWEIQQGEYDNDGKDLFVSFSSLSELRSFLVFLFVDQSLFEES